ncbi:MAG: hypothetical protein ACLFVU_05275 [Phycisphaerae bacterium]
MSDRHAGKQGKCPGCGGIITVPQEGLPAGSSVAAQSQEPDPAAPLAELAGALDESFGRRKSGQAPPPPTESEPEEDELDLTSAMQEEDEEANLETDILPADAFEETEHESGRSHPAAPSTTTEQPEYPPGFVPGKRSQPLRLAMIFMLTLVSAVVALAAFIAIIYFLGR